MGRFFLAGLVGLFLFVLPGLLYSQVKGDKALLAPGYISGYVTNYYGLAVAGATIGVENGPVTISGSDGSYFLDAVESGEHTMGCWKTGFNQVVIPVVVTPGDTLDQNFILTQPAMVINPLTFEVILNPGEYLTRSLSILNNGSGQLEWEAYIDYDSMPSIPCSYSIALYDTWGDGWSGCSIDVLVNDSVVLNNITLNSGGGPGIFYFQVNSGDEITTDFSPGPFITEPYYFIYDAEGEQVWFSPAGTNGPPDILPGQLTASCSGGEWITLNEYQGTVPPFGGVDNVITYFDATGAISGEIYTAGIIFSSTPDIGSVTIPVTMTVQGTEIFSPVNLAAELSDPVTGLISLSWDWTGDQFQFFLVKRNGTVIATTSDNSYDDLLPDHGIYCYTVQAVYNDGMSSPEGPVCIEWPDPVLSVDTEDLEGAVWPDYSVDVYTAVGNTGEGTLTFSFPEFAAMNMLQDPSIQKNSPGAPVPSETFNYSKGNDNLADKGYPVVLGAGGPDNFGYVWIDSDEDGGPEYNFTDISTTGNPVFGLSDDNIVGPFSVGFDFYYYGESKNQFWINSNGVIGFTSTYITIQNTTLPTNSSVYKDFIAWMWDDLVFKPGTSQVFYQGDDEKLIIQFKNYEQYDGAGKFINAEMILYKNGRIKILYDDFAPGIKLNICTVGLQSSAPGTGLQVVFNASYLHNDLAILFCLPSEFITDIEPVSGTVPSGESEVVTITYNAEGYDPGTFHQDLFMETNDLANQDYVFHNTMFVYQPAIFTGIVTDKDNDEPVSGVLVTAGPFQASTGENGEYTLLVDEGSYDIGFSKLGYMPGSVRDTVSLQGQSTQVDISLWDMNYAPGFVQAEVLDDNYYCQVFWSLPDGPYEIVMDDGEAEDFFVFNHAGSWHAVKFTPAGYPCTVIGGQFNVGDGSFPGPFLGTEFGVAVFDDDGPNGLPGTMLDSNGVTVNNSGWVSLDWLDAEISEGSFYLAMYQAGNSPNAAPIGVDNGSPVHFKSFTKFLDNEWTLSPFQDFMIRAWINGPENDDMTLHQENQLRSTPRIPANWHKFALTRSGKAPALQTGFERNDAAMRGVESYAQRDVVRYEVAKYLNFDPDDPLSGGTIYHLTTTTGLSYGEIIFPMLQYWAIFAVRAVYTSGFYSDYTYSNIVGYNMDVEVTVNTSLTTGEEPSGVEVSLEGLDYPHEVLELITGPDGTVAFEKVWIGLYNVRISKIGFETYVIDSVEIHENETFDVILSEKKYPPRNLVVDPVSLVATWEPPLMTALSENFEKFAFPPTGWQISPNEDSWFRTDDVSGGTWTIPAWDSFFACALDAGTNDDGCCDYLITPPLDLRENDNFYLFFDSYYDGAYGQLAFVEYSTDDGLTWTSFHQIMPDTSWNQQVLPLADFAGINGSKGIRFAFHADDAGEFASGWAVDNVMVKVPSPAADYLDFTVFLDDVFVGNTIETLWDFAPLPYGQTYTVSVAAHYSSGLSEKLYYSFTSKYLFPPQNLEGEAPDDAAILTWDPPGTNVPLNLLGYNIYRDEIFVTYLEHIGNWQLQGFVDLDLDPGKFDYTVTGVYDLTPYGFPGETGESMAEGPELVVVDYCNELEFWETWDIGGFEPNEWITEGQNWIINGRAGSPPPVVEFTSEPVQTDYELALESYPLCADGITEGNIYLDFSLELYSLVNSGNERLVIQVWNWTDRTWENIEEFDNAEGNIPLTKVHLNITQEARNSVFKIRFLAKGLNSADIRGWFVDNIHVYRKCPGVKNLAIDPDYSEGIRLTWEMEEYDPIGGGDATRDLVGFNIYRKVDQGGYELIETLMSEMVFIEPESNLVPGTLYCYMVTAIWQSETDQCVSDFSNEACVLWTDITEPGEQDSMELTIYPNPARSRVYISSPEPVNRLTISQVSGKVAFDSTCKSNLIEINTEDYPAGIYVVRAETMSGVVSRRLTICR